MSTSQLPNKRRKRIVEEQTPKKLNILEDISLDDDIPLSQFTAKLKTVNQPITPIKIEKGPESSVGLHQSSKKRKIAKQTSTVVCDSELQSKKKKSHEYSTFLSMTTVAVDYNVRARILHIWHVRPYSNQPLVMMFTARDEQGILREGLVPQDLASVYKDTLKECTSYKIVHVAVADSDTQTKLVDCPYRLLFTNQTKIQELPNNIIPIEPLYELVALNETPALLTNRSLLKGFVAVVTDIRPPVLRITKNGPIRFVELFITDATIWPRCAIVTVWQDIYNNYVDMLASGFTKQFVVIGIGLRAAIYRENFGFQTTPFAWFDLKHDSDLAASTLLKSVLCRALLAIRAFMEGI